MISDDIAEPHSGRRIIVFRKKLNDYVEPNSAREEETSMASGCSTTASAGPAISLTGR